jgi:hypothetical protein
LAEQADTAWRGMARLGNALGRVSAGRSRRRIVLRIDIDEHGVVFLEIFKILMSFSMAAYTRERWICDYFIVRHAARMAPNAGNDEIILLFSARGYNLSSKI